MLYKNYPGKSKNEFIRKWSDYIDDIGLMGNSTGNDEYWERLKRLREDLRRLMVEIANEKYG